MSSVARRGIVAVLALALLLSFSVPAVTAATLDRPSATVYTIDVDENGDATWTIELRYQIITDSDRNEFDSIQTDFEEGDLEIFEGIEDEMQPFAEEAANDTGRQMSITNFTRDVEIRDTVTRTVGVVSVSFEWNGFAEANRSEVRVGDVFAGGGLAISDEERLVVQRMDSLPVRSVAPDPDITDSERLVWDGPRFFEDGQPEVVFGEERKQEDENRTDPGGGDESDTETETNQPSAATALAAGLLVLVSGFAGGFYLSRTRFAEADENETDEEQGEEIEVSDELVSDEDRVVSLLEENGGKMKQAEIVDRTDWSKSKVSMLLSDMEEEGVISKLRLGRENVIELEDGDEDGAAGE
jgi:hypothetical protein